MIIYRDLRIVLESFLPIFTEAHALALSTRITTDVIPGGILPLSVMARAILASISHSRGFIEIFSCSKAACVTVVQVFPISVLHTRTPIHFGGLRKKRSSRTRGARPRIPTSHFRRDHRVRIYLQAPRLVGYDLHIVVRSRPHLNTRLYVVGLISSIKEETRDEIVKACESIHLLFRYEASQAPPYVLYHVYVPVLDVR